MKKFQVGVIGATGMVGRRFIRLLADHPWFDLALVAASKQSAGKSYREAVADRWPADVPLPENAANLIVQDAADVDGIAGKVDFVFCALNMDKAQTAALEESYAKAETPVISNNSAQRKTADVPMIIPEINPNHSEVISAQRRRLGTARGFISVKPNCSIQSYVPPLTPLLGYGVERVNACTYQAISGASKTLAQCPELWDSVIPYIGGEEEKSEWEPLKIWGRVENGAIVIAQKPVISVQCVRVPVSDGHLAAVSVSFARKPSMDDILQKWDAFEGTPQRLKLPSAPKKFLTYFDAIDRPQTALDRDLYSGMGISMGRLRPDTLFDYKFVCLSHNTLRGAAGGGVLSAELLAAQEYIVHK